MLRFSLRVLSVSLFLTLISVTQAHPSFACSGGGPAIPLQRYVEAADAIVYGRVTYTDVTGMNLVFRVKRYLNGQSGPRDIVIQMLPPRSIVYQRDRPPSMNCGGGPAALPAKVGDELVMFLGHNDDGSFQLAPHIFTRSAYAHFPTPDSVVEIGFSTTVSHNDYRNYRVSRRQLFRLIQSIPGMGKVAPEAPLEPLYAPLLVTTESERYFRVPVDGTPAREITTDAMQNLQRAVLSCWTENCTAWTPSGLDRFTVGNGISTSTVIDGVPTALFVDFFGIALAPTSDAYALWEESADGAIIRAQVLAGLSTISQYSAGTWPPIAEAHAIFNDSFINRSDLGAWSPDGRFIAFVDSRGLWLWDVFTSGSEPQLRSDTAGITAVHGYSQTARYLSVTSGGLRHYLDLVTGEWLPDGAWGIGDRALVVYETPPRILYVMPYHEDSLEQRLGNVVIRAAEWNSRWGFVALVCAAGERNSCSVRDLWTAGGGYYQDTIPYLGYAYDLSDDTGSLAIAREDRTLFIRHGKTGDHREIDLRGIVDSDIISVEWLPSLFYDPYESWGR